jgi:hypothetical protein
VLRWVRNKFMDYEIMARTSCCSNKPRGPKPQLNLGEGGGVTYSPWWEFARQEAAVPPLCGRRLWRGRHRPAVCRIEAQAPT